MSLVRKCFHALALGCFLAALVVMFKTFPSVRDGPTIKGASQQQQQQNHHQQQQSREAAAAANAAIANDEGVESVKEALESGTKASDPQARAKQAAEAAAAAAVAAEKERRDKDPHVCHGELLLDVDIYGRDVGSNQAPSAEECCVMCQEMPRCGAFTYVGSTCWFKGKVDLERDQKANPGCISGLVRKDPETSKYIQSRKGRKHRPPPPPLPPPPPYAIYLWLGPVTMAVLCCLGSHVSNGTPLLVHEGGAACSTDDCCACDG